MLNKISPESSYKYHPERTDSEEFGFRLRNLDQCISTYAMLNQNVRQLSLDIKRLDINSTCSRQLNQLKEFINKTGAKYENVYSPISGIIALAIAKNIYNSDKQ